MQNKLRVPLTVYSAICVWLMVAHSHSLRAQSEANDKVSVDVKDLENRGGGVHAFLEIKVTRDGVTKPLHEVKELKEGDKIEVKNVKDELKANLIYVNASTGAVSKNDFKWGTRGKNEEPVDETIRLRKTVSDTLGWSRSENDTEHRYRQGAASA